MTKPPKQPIRVFLDSGAFSAWRQRQTIDLEAYIRFVREVEPFVVAYAALDVIPGSSSCVRTVADVEASAKQSYENLQRMKEAGLKPVPVFHHGESFRWLERMLKDGENYIGVSTAKNLPDVVQNRWLIGDFFKRVTDTRGRPIVKVHGFGSAHVRLLRRLPFFSVDSAGWSIAAAHGQVYVPSYYNGRPDWYSDPALIAMSDRLRARKYAEDRRYANLDARGMGNIVRRFLADEVGIDIATVSSNAQARSLALATYYVKMVAAVSPALEFFFSSAYDRAQCQVLLSAKATNHLLSYWHFRRKGPEALVRYVLREMARPDRPVGETPQSVEAR